MSLTALKISLYRALLELDERTDQEVNIMYELSKDEDIQKLITEAIARCQYDDMIII